MRQILLGDIVSVARVALARPRSDRDQAIVTLLDQAHIAHKVIKRTGRAHRRWGNGSLMAACANWPKVPEPFAGDPEYLEVLRRTLALLIGWKNQRR